MSPAMGRARETRADACRAAARPDGHARTVTGGAMAVHQPTVPDLPSRPVRAFSRARLQRCCREASALHDAQQLAPDVRDVGLAILAFAEGADRAPALEHHG